MLKRPQLYELTEMVERLKSLVAFTETLVSDGRQPAMWATSMKSRLSLLEKELSDVANTLTETAVDRWIQRGVRTSPSLTRDPGPRQKPGTPDDRHGPGPWIVSRRV